MPDICIIGAGASGLAAAVIAAREQNEKNIVILEKKENPGRKLAATGNGKCNLTNQHCPGAAEILLFFDTLGIYTRTDEEGRVYPYCLQAKDVVHALTQAAEAEGVEIRTECTVENVKKIDNGFRIITNRGTIDSKKVLIAAGGKAGPQFGTSGDGYIIAKSLGHTVNRLAPVLTGIEVNEDLKALKGIRVRALVKLFKDGSVINQEVGEVQFNEDGISGICVMNLSRFIKLEKGESFLEGIKSYSLRVDFVPEMDQIQLQNFLERRRDMKFSNPDNILISIVPQQLRQRIIKECGMNEDGLQKNNLCKLTGALKSWPLSVKGTKGWKQAQCTSGGVSLDEIDMDTMMSKIHEGLYFAGEVIDYDGPCGGYNLQNAWETGIKAGRAMVDV